MVENHDFPPEFHIETMLWDLVVRNDGTLRRVAEALGKGYPTLARELNPYDPGAKPRIGHLVPIMKTIGNFEALHAIAGECGFRCVPLAGAPVPLDETGCYAGMNALIRDLGAVAESVQDGLGDGHLNRDEVADILKDLRKLQKDMDALHLSLAGGV